MIDPPAKLIRLPSLTAQVEPLLGAIPLGIALLALLVIWKTWRDSHVEFIEVADRRNDLNIRFANNIPFQTAIVRGQRLRILTGAQA
jgi:hypothetical protein